MQGPKRHTQIFKHDTQHTKTDLKLQTITKHQRASLFDTSEGKLHAYWLLRDVSCSFFQVPVDALINTSIDLSALLVFSLLVTLVWSTFLMITYIGWYGPFYPFMSLHPSQRRKPHRYRHESHFDDFHRVNKDTMKRPCKSANSNNSSQTQPLAI